MADVLPIRVEGTDQVAARLARASSEVKDRVRQAIAESAARVTAIAKDKLSDDVLHVRTGRLRRSIHFQVGGTPEAPSAAVGTNVEYAAIHEFGGQTKAHIIEAQRGKVLAFKGASGEMVFRAMVRHPGSRIPERSFLRSALAQEADAIRERIAAAVRESLPR